MSQMRGWNSEYWMGSVALIQLSSGDGPDSQLLRYFELYEIKLIIISC